MTVQETMTGIPGEARPCGGKPVPPKGESAAGNVRPTCKTPRKPLPGNEFSGGGSSRGRTRRVVDFREGWTGKLQRENKFRYELGQLVWQVVWQRAPG
jgi:hypothetical protein